MLSPAVIVLCALVMIATAIGYYAVSVEPHTLSVEHIRFTWPGIGQSVRIAQLSDIHISPQVSTAQLHQAIIAAQNSHADLLVLTGDFVTDLEFNEDDSLRRVLSEARFPLGIYAVLGNHDEWTDASRVAASLRNANVILLQNTNKTIDLQSGQLVIAGVGDVWEGKADLSLALGDLADDRSVVLLAHEP
jgi:predicted MPP superfamily phosphohydrolase